MAKRFTDTDKWYKDIWFRGLPPIGKCFWIYLNDVCNHAGIWCVDFWMAKAVISTDLNEDEIRSLMVGRFQEIDNGRKWFIKKHILFQQKIAALKDLNPVNKCHASIIIILINEGIFSPSEAPAKGLARGLGIGIGKGIGKDLRGATVPGVQESEKYLRSLKNEHE